MNREFTAFSRRYEGVLRKHLQQQDRRDGSLSASALGRQAMAIGIETLDLARIHEEALVTVVVPDISPSTRERMIRQAGEFFAKAITPIEKTHRTAREANTRLKQMNQTLSQRRRELIAANRQLKREIAHRKSAEESLTRSEHHYGKLLDHSQRMQEQLRLLSRQLLLAQEEERKKISRELHDVIAQTLTSINVQLTMLKKQAAGDARGLKLNIARTQRLVEKSVSVVHRFARELRPTVLDDLGLIPALQTFMKGFREETGIRVSLSAFAAVDQLNGDKRTVLYRVAQEALTNVARHAQASHAQVTIQRLEGAVCMKIKDDGKGFQGELDAQKSKRLGLLGMRERLEMVGGNFSVRSAPGKGTTILVQIPLMNRSSGGGRKPSDSVR